MGIVGYRVWRPLITAYKPATKTLTTKTSLTKTYGQNSGIKPANWEYIIK